MGKRLFAFLNRTVNKSLQEQYANSRVAAIYRCGYANGYVAVPPEHPLHGIDYNDVEEIDIHGDLTFSKSVNEIKSDGWGNDTECIDFDNFADIPKDYWVFGFDTMHFDDGPHHNREWCINETKNLMEQLEEVWK